MARGPVGGSCSCHMHRWEAGHWVPGLREGWSSGGAELLLKEMKTFWKGVAGMTSQNNGRTVNTTHKLTYTCATHMHTHRHRDTHTYTFNTQAYVHTHINIHI